MYDNLTDLLIKSFHCLDNNCALGKVAIILKLPLQYYDGLESLASGIILLLSLSYILRSCSALMKMHPGKQFHNAIQQGS